jgi:hypothetical protein
MTVRKGYSDSRLNRILRSDDDEDLNNFLPKFLVKDICKDDMDLSDEGDMHIQTTEEDSTCVGTSKQKTPEKEPYKPLRSRFNSSGDVRQLAKDYKNQLYTQFQNTVARNIPSAFGKKEGMASTKPSSSSVGGDFNYNNFGQVKVDQYNFGIFQQSANDTSNLSLLEDFNNLNFMSLRPQPKRTNSSGNLDFKPKGGKAKGSLFFNSEKSDDRCEDFEDIQHLLGSISCELWVYARSQKGSRNLQKLLNKIQPDDLDIILEKIKNNFYDLMTDIYGNYFCQKLIQCCSAEQRMFILRHIMKDFTVIGCNNSGTHALQSLIEIINMPGEEELVKEAVRDNILTLSFVRENFNYRI